jgi:3-dehydroquinate synthase
MITIRVSSSAHPYTIHFAPGLLSRLRALLAREKFSRAFILTSPRVHRYWGVKIARQIPGSRTNLFNDAESAKNLRTVEKIARDLIRAGADRQSLILALGGGVVGDVAGFVAATYLRGVKLIHVPTTLVAQVDSCIGGKTGVDLPEGKNLVGAFYPPSQILADPQTLFTLPQREYRSGLYEVIKYGVIADRPLFMYLCRNMSALLRRDPKALAYVIPRCMRIKARIVSRDEHESGLRQILNFGHTLGHAIETATRYRRFLHGEAVGCGMVAATLMARLTKRLREAGAAGAIIFRVQDVGPVPKVPAIDEKQLWRLLAADKKSQAGNVRWVLPTKIGKVESGIEVPRSTIVTALRYLPKLMTQENYGLLFLPKHLVE